MATNTTFNTRLKLKYDTLANWTTANPVLLKGEVALVEIPAVSEAATTAPTVLMKVGDGATAFNSLSYTSSRAADVYSWAKAATKPAYAASEIDGLADYISGKVQDTNTTYKIDFADGKVRLFAKNIGDADFSVTAVAEAPVPSYTLVSGSENGTVSFNGTDVTVKGLGSAAYANTDAFDAAGAASTAEANAKAYTDDKETAINDKIGAVTEGKTVVEMIADAKTAATYDDSALTGRVSAIEADYLKSADKTELEGKITAEKERMDAFLANADVSTNAVDTLKEIQEYITSDGTAAAEVTNKISALETAVGKDGDNLKSVSSQIDDKITALNLADTYEAKGAAEAAKTALIGTTEDSSDSDTIKGAKAYADAAAEVAKNGAVAAAKSAADAAYVAKEDGKGLSANDFTNTLKTKLDGVAESAQANVIEEIEVNGVAATVENKKASVSVSLDKIEANTTENYVIFDCGSASVNV